MKTLFKIIITTLLFLSFILNSYSAVEEFSRYDTKISINSDNTIDVHKMIRLQNIHSVGIVPGRIEFSIGKEVEGSVSDVTLENFVVVDRFGKEYKHQIFETPKESRIAIDIFTPLLPGFEHVINLSYTISYEDSGLFFKNLQVPIKEESNINIRAGSVELTIPKGKYFTYISDIPESSVVEDNVAKWTIDENSPGAVKLEYSWLPIKSGGFKGSYVFWIIINIILIC